MNTPLVKGKYHPNSLTLNLVNKKLDTAKSCAYCSIKIIINGDYMHKKIMEKASKMLDKDDKKYEKDAKKTKSPMKKKHDMIEAKEAKSASKDLKKRAKKAHEY